MIRTAAALATLLLAGCAGWNADGPGCRPLGPARALPDEIDESSGIAVSREHPGVLWTHNDSKGDPVLYAVDTTGRLVGRVEVQDATNRDWEDLALGECPEGGSCLYIADTGDNDEERDDVAVLRVPEPGPTDASTAEAERFGFHFPDGPRDVEAMFVLPGERLHLVTKGRNHPVTVYRYPGSLRADRTPVLEEVQRLSDAPRALPRMVTGAGADPDGGIVAVRTYESVVFHRFVDGRLVPLEVGHLSLRTLDEAQGEAVAVTSEGEVVLTSESGPVGLDRRGSLVRLRCLGL